MERKFAEDVLGAVEDLNLESVSCQTSFQDAKGVPRRIDFTIEEGKHVRIAIEVDGWDKKGTKSGPTKGDWISDRERKLSITAHGYDLIEFPNALVRTKPTNCARLIELKLRTERRHDEHAEATADDAGAPALSETEREEFGRLDAERMAAIKALEMQLAAGGGGENRGMKTVAVAFSVVLIAVLFVGWDLLSHQPHTQGPSQPLQAHSRIGNDL